MVINSTGIIQKCGSFVRKPLIEKSFQLPLSYSVVGLDLELFCRIRTLGTGSGSGSEATKNWHIFILFALKICLNTGTYNTFFSNF
jgi:hypothetical protein